MNICKNDKVGRYAVAKNNFMPGDEIFSEAPFAFGPKSDSPPLCLGCYKPTSQACSKCTWPVCSKQCEDVPAHAEAECQVFSKARAKFYKTDLLKPCLQYECITPLRVLLATLSTPERWNEEVKIMASHNALRQNQPIWHFNQVNIVNYLRGPCKLEQIFSEDLIHTVCGILEMNAFEARSASGYPIRCLFPKLAILSHNCISNINHSINPNGFGDEPNFVVTVRAAVKLHEGEELFSSYAYSMWPTMARREFLKESKYFDCSCTRCLDPTELGTNMSTLQCDKCGGSIISSSPLDFQSNWNCAECNQEKSSKEIKSLLQEIQDEIAAHPSLEELEDLFLKYQVILHPHHSIMCNLYLSLIDLYESDPDNKCFHAKKVELCKTILKVLDVIEPGFSRIRGIILYKLGTSLLLQIDTQNLLTDAITTLRKALSILKLEPTSSLEGKYAASASSLLEYCETNFQDIFDHVIPSQQLLLKEFNYNNS